MVWRQPKKELDVRNLKSTVKYGRGSVMVWGSISGCGVGNLVFIEGILNADGYLSILKENLKKKKE